MAQTLKPPTIPLANSKDIHPQTRIQDLMRLAYQLGPIFEVPMPGPGRQFVVSSFSLVDEICNDNLYDKKVSPALRSLRTLSGDGLFTADTDDPNWRKAHAILMPSFSLEAMRSYLPMMCDIAEQLMGKWSHLNPEDEIDVGDDMSRLTLDTIGLCAFSYRFNSFERHDLHPFVRSMLNILSSRQEMAMLSPLERVLHVRNVGGNAHARDCAGAEVNVTHTGGNLHIDGAALADSCSAGGNLDVWASVPVDRQVRLHAGGNATIDFPADANVSVYAHAGGNITSPTVQRHGGGSLNLVYGSGQARLDVAVGGNVRLQGEAIPR